MKKTYSKPIKFAEGDGFLHGFSTGLVKVKVDYLTARGGQVRSKLHFLLDKQWSVFLPIMVWLIDHPEGLFLVDTGENARVTEKDYFKQEGFFLNYINTRSFQFDIHPEEEVGPQLHKLGYQPKDISNVILTHLHLDHFDGLSYFEHNEILVHDLEWEKPSFALPSLYPEWFEPRKIMLSPTDNEFFARSKSLVESGEIQLVHSPGHTLGHCSVLVKGADLDYLLAGDSTYDQSQLLSETHSAGHQHFKLATKTYTAIKRYASQHNLLYLPSHDREGLERLETNQVLTVS